MRRTLHPPRGLSSSGFQLIFDLLDRAVFMKISTPAVLLIAFNRPDLTGRVFNAIRRVRPLRLFIACDGPRTDRPGDVENVAKVRAYANQVDWSCEVKTRFLDRNVGCGHGPAEAIAWFLQEAGEGIILEDDCVPEPAFFRFAAVMLDRYRKNPRVGLISGTKVVPAFDFGSSHGFSRIPACWGWATWQRAWDGYEIHPAPVGSQEAWTRVLNPMTVSNLTRAVAEQQGAAAHAWDYQFMLHLLRKDMLTVVPNDNLVLNIGFDGSGTHFTSGQRPWWVPRRSFDIVSDWDELPEVRPSDSFDRTFQAIAHGGSPKFFREWIKWKRALRALFRPEEA